MVEGWAGISIMLILEDVKTEFPGPQLPLLFPNQQSPSFTTSKVRLFIPVASGVVYPVPFIKFDAAIVKE